MFLLMCFLNLLVGFHPTFNYENEFKICKAPTFNFLRKNFELNTREMQNIWSSISSAILLLYLHYKNPLSKPRENAVLKDINLV